jgi:hypothetical protein
VASYAEIYAYFLESTRLRDLVSTAAEVAIVTGFTLRVDPYWAMRYDAEVLGLDPDEWRAKLLRGLGDWRWEETYAAWWTAVSTSGYLRRDLWHGHRWDERGPILLTVCYRPGATPAVFGAEDDVDFPRQLARLAAIVNGSGANARLEERQPARLVRHADPIVAGSEAGVIGGTLRSESGGLFGVTCAHVAKTNDEVVCSRGSFRGTCTAHTPLVTAPPGRPLDPAALAPPYPKPGNGPEINMLDAALVSLPGGTRSRSPCLVASDLSEGLRVVVTRERRTEHCRLGSLCLSYSMHSRGERYCFQETIEVVPEPRFPLAGRLGRMFSFPPRRGDSGGWVITEENEPRWAGLLFAADDRRGFAVRASWVHQWAEAQLGERLAVF